jgi:hypothetical protein
MIPLSWGIQRQLHFSREGDMCEVLFDVFEHPLDSRVHCVYRNVEFLRALTKVFAPRNAI